MTRTQDLTTPAEIATLIERSTAAGCGHLAELLRPVMRGELNMLVPVRETIMPPLHRIGRQRRPIVVMIGDDDYAQPGPSTWACSAKLRSWAKFAIVHGAGAQPEHYALAAALTLLHHRLLLIETTSEGAQDWAGFLRERPELPFMGVLPIDGAHPVALDRGALH